MANQPIQLLYKTPEIASLLFIMKILNNIQAIIMTSRSIIRRGVEGIKTKNLECRRIIL